MSGQQDSDQPRSVRTPSPFRLDLDQQRNRARELQRALRGGEAAAIARFRRHHPKADLPDDTAIVAAFAALADAQLVIAREIGLPSWPRLKAHIEAMRQTRANMSRGGAADAEMPTLHIRCGSDIRSALGEAGLRGDFLEYSDALCQGPVLATPDWLAHRAEFLAEAYGGVLDQSLDQIRQKLEQAEARLAEAARTHDRVVLWFEHDSYDQLVLSRCLAQFRQHPPRRLELIAVNRYPGAARFIGLGQLPPEALRLLWQTRQPVTEAQLALGAMAWDGLRADDPTALTDLARAGTPALPDLGPALRRHCQELPWTHDGLSLTERLVLQSLAERSRTAGEIFTDLMRGREPLPWLGDIMLLGILNALRRAAPPPMTGSFEGRERHWTQEWLALSGHGRAVLAGTIDHLQPGTPPRWLGGVRLAAEAPCWRWDATRHHVVLSRPRRPR